MCKLLSKNKQTNKQKIYLLKDVESMVAISLTCISNIRQGQLRGVLGENVEVTFATVTSHTHGRSESFFHPVSEAMDEP